MAAHGIITADDLRQQVASDAVDTVLVCFPDMQGRLMGKRVTGRYFVDTVLEGTIEACDYLLAVDVDMTPLPGYTFASWDTGYGDMSLVPDLATLRRVPWIPKTALVLCDLVEEGGTAPIEVSPRQILRRQLARAAARGLTVKIGAELEFFLFKDTYAEAKAAGYKGLTPHSDWIEDYHILQTTRDEHIIRQIRNGMDAAGVPVEFSKGEAGYGQHEINLVYAEALEMADRHAIYKNGAKEIAAANDVAITFMAKWSMDDVGSSCHIHSSVWADEGHRSLALTDSGDPKELSATVRSWLGGLVAASRELSWLFAPNVNSYKRFMPDSWAPTAIAWGDDNRTCGLRIVGHGAHRRVESRIPGADVNPYLAYAGIVAAGLHGIENEIDPGPAFEGNAYEAPDVERIPSTLVEAIDLFEGSTIAREAFGDDVHHHLLNTARQEWLAANRTVTDWELMRGFERL
ncbi:glutamine synthetase [Iamia sp. SCSIO 61187]|uniref:glutamine synthetase family protein n=1 Tax=Iamia sp. SCSIO 61187 TaxID=2722752 RepID=UPI001C62B6C6|nr:glutamine synthetase family protein [Iamia sp. SCSIO 61187]QYG92866.1 glutamine synthetase [Iamia sp. SCSIO 61187]